jgi:predicted nucleotidyltransferase
VWGTEKSRPWWVCAILLAAVTQSTNPALRAVLDEFRSQLSEHFGPRLVSLTLFGSYARGDAGPDSDIDVAVVLDRIDSHAERIWPMQLSGSLEGPVLVPIVLSKAELDFLRAREDSLAESLDRDGIALLTEAA